MIDLTTKSLPNTVSVGGKDFSINTDFRLWMRFEIEVGKMGRGDYIDVAYLFKDEHPAYISIPDLFQFSRPQSELPRPISHSDVIAYDYELDSDLIFAAFWGQYGIDLTTIEDLHWHKFLALFKGLNESTRMREVMQYRCYEKSSNKEKDIYEELRRAWEIERKSPEEQAEIEKFSSYFD